MTLTTLLIGLAVLLLIVVVLGQVSKLGDLMVGLLGDEEKSEETQANIYATLFVLVGVIGIVLLLMNYFSVEDKFLPEAASKLGRDYNKFFTIYSTPIIAVFFITHGALFAFAYLYRYKKGRKVFYFAESHKLELIWTSVPLVVVLALGLSTFPKWIAATSKPSDDALQVKVTGMQFKWFVAYPGKDKAFGERSLQQHGNLQNLLGLNPNDTTGYDDVYVEEIVLPVNQEVVFDLSAIDVIHDFYLPHFRVKMDAIPGVPTRLKIIPDKTTEEMRELTGNPEFNFEMACAELCGTGHWNMRRVVKVVSEQEYKTWLAEQMSAKELYYNDLLAKQVKEKAEAETLEHSPVDHDTKTKQHKEDNHGEAVHHDATASL